MDTPSPEFIKLSDSVKDLLIEVKVLISDVKVMQIIFAGDPMQGRPGVIIDHRQLMRDVYGTDTNGNVIKGHEKNTLLYRISKLEDTQKKVVWIFSGVAGLIVAIKFGMSALIEKVFK